MITHKDQERMYTQIKWLDAPARALMSLLFLSSGIGKISAVAATQGFMEAYGVSGVLLWPAAVLEIGGGVMLLIGFKTRPLSIVLAGWCLLTAFIFHTKFADQAQMIDFLKNMAMTGGFLLLAKSGAQSFSVDGLFASTVTDIQSAKEI
jgi:putative oxidoreductase